jgi:hypothetical protein
VYRWTIEPGIGVGPLKLGAGRAEIRKILAVPFVEDFEGGKRESPIDCFRDLESLSVCYRSDEKCVAIVVWHEFDLVLDGISIFAVPFPALARDVRSRDPAAQVDRSGIMSNGLGVFFHAEGKTDEREVSNVVVFAHGYYTGA